MDRLPLDIQYIIYQYAAIDKTALHYELEWFYYHSLFIYDVFDQVYGYIIDMNGDPIPIDRTICCNMRVLMWDKLDWENLKKEIPNWRLYIKIYWNRDNDVDSDYARIHNMNYGYAKDTFYGKFKDKLKAFHCISESLWPKFIHNARIENMHIELLAQSYKKNQQLTDEFSNLAKVCAELHSQFK